MFKLLAFMSICAAAHAQGPVTTAFTYQGELRQSGNPVSGLYDLRFRLYDSPTGGIQLGSQLCADNTSLSAGRFTIALDFGAQFTGQQRFLEIDARQDTGLDCSSPAGFTPLSPRQPLTNTPYAAYALSTAAAANATQLNGQSGSFYQNAANLNAGTIPSARLTGAYSNALILSNAANSFSGSFSGSGAGLANIPWSGITGAPPTLSLQAGTPGAADTGHFNITGNGLFGGNVGIGTTSPLRPLHVVNANTFIARFENSNTSTAITEFRNSASNTTWELDVGGTSPPFGLPAGTLYFRPTSVASALLSIDPAGNVGITKLSATSTTTGAVTVFANGSSANTTGVYGRGTAYGVFAAGLGNYGLFGESSIGYGVFASGNFGCNGSKSFRIDHPADPQNKYLLHYCAESPEVINFYRGTATLDEAGNASVDLPGYFARINRSATYQLTAIGAPMPLLHIASEIDESALAAGAAAAPADAVPVCSFRIAGGTPGGKVSWRVEAVRNDPWVRRHGAPVEIDKPENERGTYQRPALYNQPPRMGMTYRPDLPLPAAEH